MQDQALQLLINLVGIYSPSGKEETISNFLLREMRKLGFRARRDDVGNIIGEMGKGKPVVLLCGHMDTVPDQLPLRVDKDRICARGVVDAKGPLAAMIIAAASVALEPEFTSKVVVACVVEEETTSKGIKHLISNGIYADHAIFGEPSGVANITIGYKGNLHLKIICKTETGHSSTPWLFDNAIEKAVELWQKIKGTFPPIEKQKSPYYAITTCLTKLSGGKADSVVPFESELDVDIRIPPQFTSTQVFNDIRQTINQYVEANPKVIVKTRIIDSNEPIEVNKNSPLVRALSSSIRRVKKKPATLLRKTGTGDMNILGRALGIPIVTYGPGDSHLDHTRNECINVSEYLESIQIYKETILRLADVQKT